MISLQGNRRRYSQCTNPRLAFFVSPNIFTTVSSIRRSVGRLFPPQGRLGKLLRAVYHPRNTLKDLRLKLSKTSIFLDPDDLHGCSLLPEPLLAEVIEALRPKSVLDVGCGTGRSLDYFLSRNIDAEGIEGSTLGVAQAKNPDKIHVANLNAPLDLGKEFDLVWCFEVAEHIHPDYVDAFLKTLTTHSKTIVMSAAHVGQGGVGHFNEQPREYWIERLDQMGYQLNEELTSRCQSVWTWFPENLFVFKAKETNMPGSAPSSVVVGSQRQA